MTKHEPKLIQSNTEFLDDAGDFTRKHSQHITQDFLDDLKQSRDASMSTRAGEMMRVASIPTVVVEKWLREGFNIWEASGSEIVKRLKAEDLDMFLATNKRI